MPAAAPSASAILRDEHQVILRVLGVLQKLVDRFEAGKGFEAAAIGQCVDFFRLFADACHHGKEEDLLFPVLERRGIPREGGPIGCMLHEHTVGRELVKRIGQTASQYSKDNPRQATECALAAKQYIALLTQHIYKEDNILFVMGDRVLGAEDQKALDKGFGEVGCRKFQGRSGDELRRLADELTRRWG